MKMTKLKTIRYIGIAVSIAISIIIRLIIGYFNAFIMLPLLWWIISRIPEEIRDMKEALDYCASQEEEEVDPVLAPLIDMEILEIDEVNIPLKTEEVCYE